MSKPSTSFTKDESVHLPVNIVWASLRVIAFLAVVLGIAVFSFSRFVKARTNETFVGFGSEMMKFADAVRQDAPRGMWINGQRIWLSVGTTKRTVREVLDVYQARCAERNGQFGYDVAEINARAGRRVDPSALEATLRDDGEKQGYVTCIDMGGHAVSPLELYRKLERFSESGRLEDVGQLRYAYASRHGSKTRIVAIWTETGLRLRELFPSGSDAPGRDVAGIPRPPSARRILSTWEEGFPQTLTVYAASTLGPKALFEFYKQRLPKAGWKLWIDTRAPNHNIDLSLVAERDDRTVSLVFGEDPRDGRGTTTVLTSR